MKFVPTSLFTTLVLTLAVSNSNADSAKSPKCSGEFPVSMCRAFFQRWTYDETEGVCKQAVWGGCPTPDDDANFFETEAECKETCVQVDL